MIHDWHAGGAVLEETMPIRKDRTVLEINQNNCVLMHSDACLEGDKWSQTMLAS